MVAIYERRIQLGFCNICRCASRVWWVPFAHSSWF